LTDNERTAAPISSKKSFFLILKCNIATFRNFHE
jgi:hypothetical protein